MSIKQITFGSVKKKKNKLVKKFDRKSHECCVIHLIELELDKEANMNIETSDIENYITDQIPDLWNDMKEGDLIENTTESGERTMGVYFVDKCKSTDQTEGEKIIKNSLCIVGLNYSYDDWGSLPKNFFAITRFPLNYHDYENFVVNNTYSPDFFTQQSYWHTYPYAPLDVGKLKLCSLTEDNIFTHDFGKVVNYNYEGDDYYEGCESDQKFYYVIIRFKKQNYMISKIAFTEDHFTNSFKNYVINNGESGIDGISHCFGEKDNKKVYKLLEKEEVDVLNFIWLYNEL
jgi:hypothetical protein